MSDLRREPAPRVSVIMIFLNGEKYIDEAIASVCAQSYRSWELLLVDDGSTDRSSAIARSWAERHPDRIRYLTHEAHANLGMSASRNLGLREGRGTFVAFLDADDVFLPEKLERHVALLEAMPAIDVIYGATEYWYSWTGRPEDLGRDRPRRIGVAPGTRVEPPELLVQVLRDEARTPCTCGVLMRKSVVTKIGGFEEAFRGMYEDQVFFQKLFLHATVYVAEGCFERYRQHDDSWCHQSLRDQSWDPYGASPTRHQYVSWLQAYVREQRVRDPRVHREVRRFHRQLRWPRTYRALGTLSRSWLARRFFAVRSGLSFAVRS